MRRHLGLVCLLLLSASPALAVIRSVPSQYSTIQAAVNACQSGDVVQVAPGIYHDVTHPSGGSDTTKCAVVMKSNVTVRGSGSGATVIDCQSRGRGFLCRNKAGWGIEDLTVRGAYAQTYGAAILADTASSGTVRNCELTANLDGALILLNNASPTVTNCRMTGNVGKQGAGIEMGSNCSPTISGCVITGNSAPAGGGVYVRTNCHPIFRDCIISGNSINTPNGNGGGLAFSSTGATMENCYIENNASTAGGGGVYTSESTVSFTNCSVRNNRTTATYGPGGGLFIDFGSDATIVDCTIVKNTVRGLDPGPPASDGGGICSYFANQLTIRQCTIAADSCALGQGGGIALWFVNATIDKCIIANNSPGAGMYCADGSTVPVVSCTDIYGNQGGNTICGTDAGHNFSLDPQFCDLSGGDFRLRSTSPCAAGHHPDGPTACDGSRLGGEDLGCLATSVGDAASGAGSVTLLGNEPNPFRPSTTIRFSLSKPGQALLRVFDVGGRMVRTLQEGTVSAGPHEASWDGRGANGDRLPSGIYFYRLSVDGVEQSRSMVLTR